MRLFGKSQFFTLVHEKANEHPIIIYGAGMDAVWAIEEWTQYYHKPFYGCVCDGDIKKQQMLIDGVQIVSPVDALQKYPNAYIWVAAKDYKFEIIGKLILEMSIEKTRILNYEPIIKKEGCRYAEKMFFAFEQNIPDKRLKRIIHICDRIGNCPTISFHGYDGFYKEFIGFRDTVIDSIERTGGHEACQSCNEIRESYFAVSRKLRTYNLATDGHCNFRCIYCNAPIFSPRRPEDQNEIFDFRKILEIFDKNNLLSEELHMDLTSGEICVNPRRREMLDVAAEYGETVSIATNASVYDEQLFRILDSKRASIIVSMDAGTENTFLRIKQRDYYGKVCDNLLAYGKAGRGAVELKYIVLPGVNDNLMDIDGFIDLCKRVQPGIVTISFDFYHQGEIPPQTFDVINRLKVGLVENGFFYKYEARASHILKQSDKGLEYDG